MSNPYIFTQTKFATYIKGLLTNHSIELTDEEETATQFEKGGDAKKLAEMVFDVETSHLTISDDSGVLGGISLVNEYDHRLKAPTTEIYNNSMAVEHLVPQYEVDEE